MCSVGPGSPCAHVIPPRKLRPPTRLPMTHDDCHAPNDVCIYINEYVGVRMCVLASVRVCVRLFTNVCTSKLTRTRERPPCRGIRSPPDSGTRFHWSLALVALSATRDGSYRNRRQPHSWPIELSIAVYYLSEVVLSCILSFPDSCAVSYYFIVINFKFIDYYTYYTAYISRILLFKKF